jgi:putative NADPH-quinone reductase
MRVLLVHAHPAGDSFVSHLRDVAVEALHDGGHRVDVADLYREGFDPLGDGVGSSAGTDLAAAAEAAAAAGGAGTGRPGADVAGHRARLARADALVLVHPTWWGGPPAVLKGWFDQVLGEPGPTPPLLTPVTGLLDRLRRRRPSGPPGPPGRAGDAAPAANDAAHAPDGCCCPPGPPVGRLRRVATVTTHGSSRWVNRLQGEPGRCTTMRALRSAVPSGARFQWLGCYGLDRIGERERADFAERVRRTLGDW